MEGNVSSQLTRDLRAASSCYRNAINVRSKSIRGTPLQAYNVIPLFFSFSPPICVGPCVNCRTSCSGETRAMSGDVEQRIGELRENRPKGGIIPNTSNLLDRGSALAEPLFQCWQWSIYRWFALDRCSESQYSSISRSSG